MSTNANTGANASREQEGHRLATTLTMAVLIAANTTPLIGVLFFDWKVFEVLALFWLENVFIGVLNVVRMATILFLRGRIETIFLIPFFCVHYGMFTMVHGIFVMTMFGPKDAEGNPVFDTFSKTGDPFDDPFGTFAPMFHDLYWAAAALFASHFFSYLVHFLGRGEYKETDGGELMAKPYGRVVVLHITILLGGGLAMATGQNIYALAMLVLLKIAMDVMAHRKQHALDKEKKAARATGVSGGGPAIALFGGKRRGGDAFPDLANEPGFSLIAAKPNPKVAAMPPWARKMVGLIGGAMNVDMHGDQARQSVRKFIREGTSGAAEITIPEDLVQRVQRFGVSGAAKIKVLLDDGTVLGFDYFENVLSLHGRLSDRPHNIDAAVKLARSLPGFEAGVRVKATVRTLENDVVDSLKSEGMTLV